MTTSSFPRHDVLSFVTISLVLLIFVLASVTTSFVLTKQAYSTGPAGDWVLVGGLTANSANVRVRRSNNNNSKKTALVVSTTPDLSEPVFEQALSAYSSGEDDVASIVVDALEAVTRYYYAVVNDAGEHSPIGFFQTPAAEGQPFNFTIAAAGCSWTGSRHAVFQEIAKEEPLIFFHLGDFHYEDIGENDMKARVDAIGMTLGSPEIASLYRRTALVSMWDDHDYMGIGGNSGYAEEEEGARDTALKSYQKLFPHYPLAVEGDAVSPYHSFTIGTVRFVITDLRSETTDTAIYSEEQRAWFKAELSQAANFDFVVWVSTKPWIGEPDVAEDTWFGSEEDRKELSEFISHVIGGDDGPQNLIAISADAHMVAFDDGTNTYYGSDETSRSFPILQTGPLDRMGNKKGGPFTDGCHATDLEKNHQYSTISFEVPSNGGESCMTIRSYRVDSFKNEILSRKLCGRIFKPSVRGVRKGTCEIKRFSNKNKLLFGFAVANTFIATLTVCYAFSCRRSIAFSALVWMGLIASLAAGGSVPLVQGLPDLNMFPINLILSLQSVVIVLYVTMCYFKSSPKQDSELREKEAELKTPTTTVHGMDEDSDLWLSAEAEEID